MDQRAAAELGPPRRLRGLPDRLAVLPRRRHPDPGARHLRQGQRALVLAPERRRSARPSTSCCRSPPSAPAASPGSTTSPTARARRRGSPASRRAPRCRRSRARRTRLRRQDEVFPVTSRGLDIFERAAPEGVRVPAGAGVHYAQYSFEPRPADPQRLRPVARRALRLRPHTPADDARDRRCSRPARRAPARRSRPTTPARGRCTRAGPSRTSPTSATTRCCATSSTSLCNRTRSPTYCGAERALHGLPDDRRRSCELGSRAAARRRRTARSRCRSTRSPASTLRDHARREARAHALRRQPLARAAHARLAGAAQAPGSTRSRSTARDLAGNPATVDRRRRGAEAAQEEARAGRLPGLHGAPDDPLHGQGRRRQDVRRHRDRPALRRRGRAHDRALDGPRALARRVARDRRRRPRRPTSAAGCSPSRSRPRTSSSATGRACSAGSAAMLMERGVDRIAAEELTVPPGGDELFSLLALKAHHESGDWDVIVVDCAPTGETLRLLSFPDAAQWWLDKVLGRERALLAAARPLARTFLDLQLPDERAFARDPAAGGEPRRDARAAARRRARLDPARDDARPDGRRRGDAHVHLPEPLRLRDRRRGRQPRLPRRGRRHLLRRLARGAGRAARARRVRLRARAGAARAVLRARGARRGDARPARRARCSPGRDAGGGAARPRHAGAVAARRRRGAAAGPAVRRARATCR